MKSLSNNPISIFQELSKATVKLQGMLQTSMPQHFLGCVILSSRIIFQVFVVLYHSILATIGLAGALCVLAIVYAIYFGIWLGLIVLIIGLVGGLGNLGH